MTTWLFIAGACALSACLGFVLGRSYAALEISKELRRITDGDPSEFSHGWGGE